MAYIFFSLLLGAGLGTDARVSLRQRIHGCGVEGVFGACLSSAFLPPFGCRIECAAQYNKAKNFVFRIEYAILLLCGKAILLLCGKAS